jgi:hypothetical protein
MFQTLKNSLDGSEKRWRVVGQGHALDPSPASLVADSKTGAEQSDAAALLIHLYVLRR